MTIIQILLSTIILNEDSEDRGDMLSLFYFEFDLEWHSYLLVRYLLSYFCGNKGWYL